MRLFDLCDLNLYQRCEFQDISGFKFSFIDLLILLGTFENRINIIYLLYFKDKPLHELKAWFKSTGISTATLRNDLVMLEEYGVISTYYQDCIQVDKNGIERLRYTKFYTIYNQEGNADILIIACLLYLYIKQNIPSVLEVFKSHNSKFRRLPSRKSINTIRFVILKLLNDCEEGTDRLRLRYSSEWFGIRDIQFDTIIRELVSQNVVYEEIHEGKKYLFLNDEFRYIFREFVEILNDPLSALGIRFSLDLDFTQLIHSHLESCNRVEYLES